MPLSTFSLSAAFIGMPKKKRKNISGLCALHMCGVCVCAKRKQSQASQVMARKLYSTHYMPIDLRGISFRHLHSALHSIVSERSIHSNVALKIANVKANHRPRRWILWTKSYWTGLTVYFGCCCCLCRSSLSAFVPFGWAAHSAAPPSAHTLTCQSSLQRSPFDQEKTEPLIKTNIRSKKTWNRTERKKQQRTGSTLKMDKVHSHRRLRLVLYIYVCVCRRDSAIPEPLLRPAAYTAFMRGAMRWVHSKAGLSPVFSHAPNRELAAAAGWIFGWAQRLNSRGVSEQFTCCLPNSQPTTCAICELTASSAALPARCEKNCSFTKTQSSSKNNKKKQKTKKPTQRAKVNKIIYEPFLANSTGLSFHRGDFLGNWPRQTDKVNKKKQIFGFADRQPNKF